MTNALLNQAKTGSTVDQTKEPERRVFEIPPAGPTPARFVGYVEVGKQPQEFDGKEKAPALAAFMTFELNGPKHRNKIEVDGVEKEITNTIRFDLPVYTNSKASFHKLFAAMRQERESITHMAQMLGEGFLIHVVHNVVGEGDAKKTYANMKDSNGWRIGPPILVDPLDPDNIRQIPVPEVTKPYQLLLWDNPTKEQWDSIFIDGVREVKQKDGTTKNVSKNWLQERCMASVDFETSALADLLTGIGELTEEIATAAKATDTANKQEEKQAVKQEEKQEVKQEVKQEAKATVTEKQSADAADVLASLGLTS